MMLPDVKKTCTVMIDSKTIDEKCKNMIIMFLTN